MIFNRLSHHSKSKHDKRHLSDRRKNIINEMIIKNKPATCTNWNTSLQACFVVAHSSGELMRIDFTIAYIQYNLHDLTSLIYAARNWQFSCCFLWRQEDTSSLRLFSVDSSGRQIIRNFSLRQRLHLLLELLYGECDERMRQEIKCSMLLSLRVQICLLCSVEFLCLAWRNDGVWFLYLVLKSFSVSPMYVSVVLLSLRVTVAW